MEVLDFALPESPREAGFRFFLNDLRQRLSQAMAVPPPAYGQADLAILAGCVASQGNALGLDMVMVRSLQDRFNSLPPSGVRPR